MRDEGSNRTCAHFVPLRICFPPSIKKVSWCVAVQLQRRTRVKRNVQKYGLTPMTYDYDDPYDVLSGRRKGKC
jgi:hypothetical protein